jgi:regulator of protease activity HflC (stomatin/prohibitin superfamily)
MIHPGRAARFIARAMSLLLPIVAILFLLALLTELSQRSWRLGEMTRSQLALVMLRDMVPGLVAVFGVYLLATRFVGAFYRIDDFSAAQGFVAHRLCGLFKFGPWMKVQGGRHDDGGDQTLMRAGGPGHLVIYSDSAVLLERNGVFTRVHGKGFVPLEPFERLYDMVDLRPMRRVYEVEAMSREGIPVACDAEISFQIDNQGFPSTEEVPYPVSESRVLQAITCKWIREADRREDTRTMDWAGRVIISETEGNLRTILARHPLDRLIGLASAETQNPRESIRQELEEALRTAVPRLGARVLNVELADIRVRDEVTRQWIDAWKARWERWATEREALGKARQVEQLESAKTRAQVMMITTITDAFRPMMSGGGEVTSKLVLTRLFMVLSRACGDPLARVYLPQEAVNTLNLLRDMLI